MYKNVDFIYNSASALEEVLGIPIEVQSNRQNYDAIVEIKGMQFYGVAKKYAKNVSYSTIKEALSKIDNRRNKLFIADHLPKNKAEYLKENNINYIDAAGNAFIKTDSLLIYVEGKTLKQPVETKTRAFQEAGLKLLLLLISQPESLQFSYRELAKKTEIAVGSVSNIFKELENGNYLLKTNKKRILKNEEELINRWVVNYNDYVKPRIVRKKMRALDENFKPENYVDNPMDFYFGGEPAGALLTNQLIPKDYIIYSNAVINDIAKKLKLVPDENGNIELRHKFWSNEVQGAKNKVAPKLVVYADLINSNNQRNVEVAETLWENGV